MLGREVVEELEKAGFEVEAPPRSVVDITSGEAVRVFFEAGKKAGLVVNCAAYTAVDKAESEIQAALAVNRDGPANLAGQCAGLDLPLIHISTDYVFNGRSEVPYREDDPASPLNAYGRSKWEGEEAIRSRLARHVIVRTSWLYGARGANFVKTMIRLGRERGALNVVCDQRGSPTWTRDLARCIARIACRISAAPDKVCWGAYHFCGRGVTTWYDFACAVLENSRGWASLKVAKVNPVPTSSYPTPAVRPSWSVLDCRKIGDNFGIHPPDWQTSLERMLEELRLMSLPPAAGKP